jgi:DNA-binding phage protein
MASSFDALIRSIRKEAHVAGPRAVAELRAFEQYAKGVATELSELMAKRKLSQREVGRRAHIAQPEISKILSGKSNPRIRTVQKLAHAVGAELRIVPTRAARTARLRRAGR